MFDGTGWAAAEIVVFMLIATLVGLAIGWILGRWVLRATIGRDYDSALEATRGQVNAAQTRLAGMQADLDKAQLEAESDQAELSELRGKLEKAEARRAAVETIEAELAAKEAEIALLTADLDSSQAERTALTEELEQTSAALTAKTAQLEALEADLTTPIATAPAALVEDVVGRDAADMSAAAAPVGPGSGKVLPTREEGLARIAEIAARTAGPGPRVDDDLKKVHGIGPKMERALKGFGITSFKQIANLRPEDIAYVTVALDAFRGRIERDDWMGGAAKEHAKKYGEPASP